MLKLWPKKSLRHSNFRSINMMCFHFRNLRCLSRRDVQSHLQGELLSNDQTHLPETSFTSHRTGHANDEDAIVSRERTHRNRVKIIILVYWKNILIITLQRPNSTFESRGFDRPALEPDVDEVRESATMNTRHSRSLSDPGRPIVPQSRRTELSPLIENPNTLNFLEETPFEEDLEEREPNSPPGSQPMVRSAPNSPLNRTATSRHPQASDNNYLVDPSSPVALSHSRTMPLSYRPSAPARLGDSHRRIQDDDDPEPSTHDSEFASNTGERGATSSQGSARRRPSYLPLFGSVRR